MPLTREALERRQVWVYLAAVLAGLALGGAAPKLGPALEGLLWPALAVLLYATFTQTRLARLPAAFRDLRFTAAVMLGNFAVLPLFVWALLALVPDDPAIRLGVLLVLLVPCTDWFITFAHQAGGDLRRAIAITPALLVVQIVLLPAYLWLVLGESFAGLVPADRVLTVFAAVIVLPLALAFLTERWADRAPARAAAVDRLGWLSVPLLALVLFVIAASQVEAVRDALPLLADVLAVFLAFLAGAVICGVALGRVFRLSVPEARTLLFSFSTRNSFVVLPIALALPPAWEAAVVVIVLQSLVELFAVLALLWLVPRKLMPG